MSALLDACSAETYPAKPVLVLSNRPKALGLEVAAGRGVATAAVDHKTYGDDRRAFEEIVHAQLESAGTQIIALAGFMRVLTPWFVERWAGRMINIHPSLLPKYPGLNTHQRAIDAGDTHHGCSVHWVTPVVDAGAVIDQEALTIAPGDTPETLADRLLPLEHRLYPRALEKACQQLSRAQI